MNLFFSNTEMLVFVLLAIPFVGVAFTAIVILYSDAFAQAHAVLANRMFNGKSTKIVRMILLAIAAVVCNYYHWLMVETLLIAIIGYHVVMGTFFKNKVVLNLSARKY